MSGPLGKFVRRSSPEAIVPTALGLLLDAKAEIDHKLDFFQMAAEAYEQESSPYRDRVVIKEGNEYLATYTYEINPDNGWCTVGIYEEDGSQNIMPVRPHRWCLYLMAEGFFGIEKSSIKITDKEKDYAPNSDTN